jgi:ketosteroid isomerase-like protein
MTAEHSGDEIAIRQQLDKLLEAIRAADLDGVKAIYAHNIVSFDVGPPLQRVGVEGKCQNWEEVFTMFQPPIGYEIRELMITSGGGVAYAHSFNRLSGTLKDGSRSSGIWVRATFCFVKIAGEWRIAHDHVSVPLNFESALLNQCWTNTSSERTRKRGP